MPVVELLIALALIFVARGLIPYWGHRRTGAGLAPSGRLLAAFGAALVLAGVISGIVTTDWSLVLWGTTAGIIGLILLREEAQETRP